MRWFVSEKCRSKVKLDGKTAIITGANTGIGKFTANDFAQRGATVILACRNTIYAEKTAEEIKQNAPGKVIVEKLDLSSLKSIKEFAKRMLKEHNHLHILVNNAGVMACPKLQSQDGYELQFATNHLGHFYLTHLLLPAIIRSAPARIVNVSSLAHKYCNNLHLDDINLDKNYSPITAYSRSKVANILFTMELANRLEGTGVTTYSLHPGVVRTELTRHLDRLFFRGFERIYSCLGWFFLKSPKQGAQTTLYCALEESIADKNGTYYANCKETRPSRLAADADLAKQLWTVSEEMIKNKGFPLANFGK